VAAEGSVIALHILLWLLVVVAGLLVLLLVMPLRFGARGAIDEADGLSWQGRVAWGFGLVTFRAVPDGMTLFILGIPIWRRRPGGRRRKPERKKEKPDKQRKPRKPKSGRGLRWLLLRRRLLLAIAGRYLRALHLEGRIEGLVGLPDPDQTARLHQLLVALDAALPAGFLDIEVDWVEEVVALRGRLEGWVWPLQIAGITLALFLDAKTRRALRAPRAAASAARR
jgi:hypothetical protein